MKMNNKGFTLIELLGVIVLLAVVTTIAVPSIMGISRNVKQNMLDAKMELILEDAKLYGQDNLSYLLSKAGVLTGNGTDQGYPCIIRNINELVYLGYIDPDDEDGNLINPLDNSNLGTSEIIIYYKNKRIIAKFHKKEFNKDGKTYGCTGFNDFIL